MFVSVIVESSRAAIVDTRGVSDRGVPVSVFVDTAGSLSGVSLVSTFVESRALMSTFVDTRRYRSGAYKA